MSELIDAKSYALTILLAYTLPLANRAKKAKECAARLASEAAGTENEKYLLDIANMSDKEVHICLRTLRSRI